MKKEMSEFRYNNICQKRTELWPREELSMAIPKGKKTANRNSDVRRGAFLSDKTENLQEVSARNDMSGKEREGEVGWTTTYSKKYGAVGAGLT